MQALISHLDGDWTHLCAYRQAADPSIVILSPGSQKEQNYCRICDDMEHDFDIASVRQELVPHKERLAELRHRMDEYDADLVQIARQKENPRLTRSEIAYIELQEAYVARSYGVLIPSREKAEQQVGKLEKQIDEYSAKHIAASWQPIQLALFADFQVRSQNPLNTPQIYLATLPEETEREKHPEHPKHIPRPGEVDLRPYGILGG